MDDSRRYTVSVNPIVAFSSGHGNWNIKSASLICAVAHTMTKTTLILSHLSPIYLMSCVFTVHITFINFDKHWPDLGRYTCLAPERFKRSICGPRPKKVVHHCSISFIDIIFAKHGATGHFIYIQAMDIKLNLENQTSVLEMISSYTHSANKMWIF